MTHRFEQRVPIPSYLFALASGDIATAKIGRNSVVATGPNELENSQWELEEDLDKFMDAAEKLIFPYKWGEYNVLVLPPSFPYGGRYIESPIHEIRRGRALTAPYRNGEPHFHIRNPNHYQWRPTEHLCHCP
jgi:hypothetical protein